MWTAFWSILTTRDLKYFGGIRSLTFFCPDTTNRSESGVDDRASHALANVDRSYSQDMEKTMDLIKAIEADHLKEGRDNFRIGDTVKVHFSIVEGRNERVQIYEGLVIARKNSGVRQTFTVRKLSYGVGVERVFPVHSPRIQKIEVTRRGRVRRSKLYYIRDRVGKRAKVAELIQKRDRRKVTKEG